MDLIYTRTQLFACLQYAWHCLLDAFVNRADQVPALVGLNSRSRFDCPPERESTWYENMIPTIHEKQFFNQNMCLITLTLFGTFKHCI